MSHPISKTLEPLCPCGLRPASPTCKGLCPPCYRKAEREGVLDAQIAAQYRPEHTMTLPFPSVPVSVGRFEP